jgi:type IV pilus assembly protein PilX
MNTHSTHSAQSAHSVTRKRGEQRGAVMIVSMIMLLIVTLLAVAAVQTSNLEVLMATNTQARASALATAENGLVDGERWITDNFPGTPLFDWSADAGNADEDGKYTGGDIADPVDTIDWATAPVGANPPIGYELSPNGGQYALEYLGPFTTFGASLTMGAGAAAGDKRFLYRITGRGVFGTGGTRFVQSIFATKE